MKKNAKILIIGFGSIGKRHWKNLLALGYRDVYVYDPDKKKIDKRAQTISKLSEKELSQFKIAFICNPTHLHIKTALLCARAGCHLFIEKPLSRNLKNINNLIAFCKKKKLFVMVACNMRFHPCLRRMKELVDSNFLGKIYAIYLEYGYFLPYQRSGVNYRKVYASSRKMGGGVMLDNIHDFDLAFWFNDFKKLKRATFLADRVSNLKINVEDICLVNLEFSNKVLASLRSDYLQQMRNKNCKIIGEKGNLSWDSREGVVYFEKADMKSKGKRKKIFKEGSGNQDRMYLDEVRYYLERVEKKEKTFNDLERAFMVLKLILPNK